MKAGTSYCLFIPVFAHPGAVVWHTVDTWEVFTSRDLLMEDLKYNI